MTHEIKRTERGWPAHFIGANDCSFRRNTILECDFTRDKAIVSTVGRYKPRYSDYMKETMGDKMRSLMKDGYMQVGYDRYFETMAFKAKFKDGFWDADVDHPIQFDSNWSLPDPSMENEANDMHEAVVAEITTMLAKGETLWLECYSANDD